MPSLEGVVENIIYRNEANGWTVIQVKSGRSHVTATGLFFRIFFILHGNFLWSMYLTIYRVDIYRKIFTEKGGRNEKEIKGNSNDSIHNDAFRHGATDSISVDPWLSV